MFGDPLQPPERSNSKLLVCDLTPLPESLEFQEWGQRLSYKISEGL